MSAATLAAWIDGRRLEPAGAPALSLADRGFLLGDAAFETMRVAGGRVPEGDRHLARLTGALAALGIEPAVLPAATTLASWCAQARLEEGVLRVTVSRGAGGRGLAPAGEGATVAVTLHPPPAPLPAAGVLAFVARPWVHPRSPLAGLKVADRAGAVVQARPGAEGVVVDSGEVLCGLASNVFVVRRGVIATPPATGAVRAGVMREILLEDLAPALGLAVEVRRVEVAELSSADELVFTSAVRGPFAARALEASAGTPGRELASEIAGRLARASGARSSGS